MTKHRTKTFPVAAPSADMEQVDEKRLAEIRERESKATKGPWFFASHYDPQIEMLVSAELANDEHDNDPVLMRGYTAPDSLIEANWEFVQNARQDIPYLLAYIVGLLEQIESLRRSVPGNSVENGWNDKDGKDLLCPESLDVAPATVPATPEPHGFEMWIRGYRGIRHINDWLPPDWLELGQDYGDYRAKATPATTQGTPEGAKQLRCQARQPHGEKVQCELPLGHKSPPGNPGFHLGGEYCWNDRPAASQKGEEGK